MRNILSEFVLSDMLLTYVRDEAGAVGMELIPLSMRGRLVPKTYSVDPLIHAHARGDDLPGGFSSGHTLRNSPTTLALRYAGQTVERENGRTVIMTTLRSKAGHAARHILTYRDGAQAFTVRSACRNESDRPVTLELLTSFSLGGISPFLEGDSPDSLLAHRVRSCWTAEGRLVSETLEELQLEPSFSKVGVRTEKFGQVGSMPVRKYFPFAAVEDTVSGVTWAAQVACASSWQMEYYRRDDALCLSGGLADADFGQWSIQLSPGEELVSPEALLTVGNGGVDSVSQRLLSAHRSPAPGGSLPVVFNEFCTTWGRPSFENIQEMTDALRERDIDYFVIDAGWYSGRDSGIGDWDVSPDLYPQGLEAAVGLIRQAGMVPGIWFEFETCEKHSRMFQNTSRLLTRDGFVITAGDRRFLDMREAWVEQYLTRKVIGTLKKYQFSYLKIDYNETLGAGCDGADSPSEGLRQNILATQRFMQKIRREVPGIVLENYSSGGHRLEPSMLGLCDLASFSDAHECIEIPILAANLHRLVRPDQSLIWAVLRKTDSPDRIVYSMAAAFLGVLCLSGDVCGLNEEQWALADRGIRFYRKISGITRRGVSAFFGPRVRSFRHPEGWQCVVRYSADRKEAAAVLHTFAGQPPAVIELPLAGAFAIAETYGTGTYASVEGTALRFSGLRAFQACAVLLKRSEG